MLSKKYRLSYLPLFYENLDEKITYIRATLSEHFCRRSKGW